MKFQPFLFSIFFVHLFYNLERFFFLNELFSITGLLYLLFNFNVLINLPFRPIIFCILAFILYLSVLFVLSLIDLNTTYYNLLRTMPFYYSIFSFFTGIYFGKYLIKAVSINSFKHFKFTSLIFSFLSHGRLASVTFIPIFLLNYNTRFLGYFILLILFYFAHGGATSIFFILFFLAFYLIYRIHYLRLITFSRFSFFFYVCFSLCGLYILYPQLDFSTHLYYQDSFFDVNSMWRLMYWSILVFNTINDYFLFGIGFGTPLFDISSPEYNFVVQANPDDDHLPYVHGPHNSFMYIFARSGIFGFILCSLIPFLLFRFYFLNKLFLSNYSYAVALAFLFICVASLFNVILESPLYASVYWIFAGIFYHSIYCHKSLRNESK